MLKKKKKNIFKNIDTENRTRAAERRNINLNHVSCLSVVASLSQALTVYPL